MKKTLLTCILLSQSFFMFAQVGINTTEPKTTLDINGSLANREAIVSLISNSVDITPTMSQYRITGTATQNFSINVSAGYIEGQRLVIFNDTTGGFSGTFNNINISNGFAIEFIYSNNAWRSTSTNSTIISLYSSQLKIPPHSNSGTPVADFTGHSNTAYDFNNWHVISKASTSVAADKPSKMQIVYEYQGTPFKLDKLYPIFTAGNNTSYPDTYLVNFIDINNTSGKTRMTVVVTRMDNFDHTTINNNANWAGTFLINVLLVNSSI